MALLRNEVQLAAAPLVSPLRSPLRKDAAPGSGTTTRYGAYTLRLANNEADRRAVCRLRFLVFNLELNEGLDSAYEDGYDTDCYDDACDHLMVEHSGTGQVVGTYRLQTGTVAGRKFGYYSAREFDFSPYERLRGSLVELGRAAIHRDHRSFRLVMLLWRGIVSYAAQRNGRYLIGCSSLTSQSSQDGSNMFWRLLSFQVEPALRTNPLPEFECTIRPASAEAASVKPPTLLRAYLSVGARICGPPAIDREFKTIDFLTLLDLDQLGPITRTRFLAQDR
jgi:putative hemolysin